MNQAEQKARIIALEQQAAAIAGMVNQEARETEKRIERLETAVLDLHDRVGKLEVGLRDVVRCLIDGKVNVAGAIPGELHCHRLLGTESVQAMIEVYHRLKE